MKIERAASAGVAVLLFSGNQLLGIEGLKLSVQSSNVVLEWPSVSGETYIVQHRPTLDTNIVWVTLTNSLPAAAATNRTFFVHSNVVEYCSGSGGGGGGGSGGPPTPGGSQSIVAGAEGATEKIYWWDLWQYENREPNIWEKEKRPPYPWEAEVWNKWAKGQSPAGLVGAGGNSLASMSEECPPTAGFYRVVRRGVHLVGITNGMTLSGIVQIPVEAGNDQGDLSSVTLSANDAAIEGTDILSEPFSYPLRFFMDTRRLNNGTYSLKASGLWSIAPTNEFDQGYVQLFSPTITVNIFNPISYPEWVQDFRSDLMIIKIKASQGNVNWEVDVFGEAEDFIGTFSDFSADGIIAFAWDLRDANGVPRTDNVFYTQTTISGAGFVAASPNPQLNPPLIKVVDNYPGEGKWIVARASYIPTNYDNYDVYRDTVNGFAVMGESAGGVLPDPGPYRNFDEALVLSRASGLTNWTVMLNSFTNRTARNFYFDGHGGPDWIGHGFASDGTPRKVNASQVALELGNVTASTNATRYRWVWIDACSTALGQWPQTFGMGSRENVPLSDYTSRPAAYCGFTKDVYGFNSALGEIGIDSINYRSYFLLYWNAFELPLKSAFESAQNSSGFPDASFLRIYGYWNLHWDEFNTKGEWPP